MHLLPGSFDAYPIPEELESSSLSRWERVPMRPLLALSLLLALTVGAFVYLSRSHTNESTVDHAAPVASNASEPTKEIAGDTADHAMRAQRIVSGAIHDLRDIENAVEAARSDRRFSPAQIDRLEERLRATRRKLEDSLTDIKTVSALVGK